MRKTFHELGLAVSNKKSSTEPEKSIQWLGFTLSHNNVAIPQKKRDKLKETFLEVMKNRNLAVLYSFLGRASNLATIAKGIMPEIRKLQRALPYVPDESKMYVVKLLFTREYE